MDALVSTHVMLEREQKKQLRAWAADRDSSMAALVREAVTSYRRVARGPMPARVRRAARDIAGVLPLATGAADGPAGRRDMPWWPGGD